MKKSTKQHLRSFIRILRSQVRQYHKAFIQESNKYWSAISELKQERKRREHAESIAGRLLQVRVEIDPPTQDVVLMYRVSNTVLKHARDREVIWRVVDEELKRALLNAKVS